MVGALRALMHLTECLEREYWVGALSVLCCSEPAACMRACSIAPDCPDG